MANSAEIRDGLVYLLGGGWDTVTVPKGVPINFQGVVVLRLLAQPQECNRAHKTQIVCDAEGGGSVFSVSVSVTPSIPADYPPGWEIPVNIVAALAGPLPRPGLYQLSIVVNGNVLGAIPMRALESFVPPLKFVQH